MRNFIILSAFAWSLTSCSTKLIVNNQNIDRQPIPNRIVVIANDSSKFFPATIYPSYKVVDSYVVKTIEALYPIDSLICATFRERNIECTVLQKDQVVPLDAPQIVYTDYWTWDFIDYMHILRMKVYKSNGSDLMEVISQGNTSGLHSYPKPNKQVPKMVDLILEKSFNQ